MSNEVDLSFLKIPELLTKTVYDTNGDGVVDVAKAIDGASIALDDTFYGKREGVVGFHTVESGSNISKLVDLTDVDTSGVQDGYVLSYSVDGFITTPPPSSLPAASATKQVLISRDGATFTPDSIALSDIANVSTTGVANGNVLTYYEGDYFMSAPIPTLPAATTVKQVLISRDGNTFVRDRMKIGDIVGMDIDTATAGMFLTMNGVDSYTFATLPTVDTSTSISELTDVTISSLVLDQVIQWDGSKWVNKTLEPITTISGFDDINLSGVQDGYILEYNSGVFTTVPKPAPELPIVTDIDQVLISRDGSTFISDRITLGDLNGVDTSGSVANTFMRTDGMGNYTFEKVSITDFGATLNDIADVEINSAVQNQVLQYDGTRWKNQTVSLGGGTGATSINELNDVSLNSIQLNQIMQYNGTHWVNQTAVFGATNINQLTDVDTTGVQEGYVLTYVGDKFVPTKLEPVLPSATGINQVLISRNGSTLSLDTIKITDIDGVDISGALANTFLTANGSGEYTFTTLPVVNTDKALTEISDVTIESPILNQVLQYDGNKWTNRVVSTGVTTLDGLTDVDTTGKTVGSILEYDGSAYKPKSYDFSKLGNLDKINVDGATFGQVLSWNNFSNTFTPVSLPVPAAVKENLSEMNDVNIAAVTTGQVLQYNGTVWEGIILPTVTVPESLNDLNDVVITNPSADQIISYDINTGKFINKTVSVGGGGVTTLTGLSDVDETVVPVHGHVLTYNASKSQYEPKVVQNLGSGGGMTTEYVRVVLDGGGHIVELQTSDGIEAEITNAADARWRVSSPIYKYPPMATHAYSFKGADATWTAGGGFKGGNYQYLPLTSDLLSGNIGNRDLDTVYTKGNAFGDFNAMSTAVPGMRRFYISMYTTKQAFFADDVTAFTGDLDKLADIWFMFVFGG